MKFKDLSHRGELEQLTSLIGQRVKNWVLEQPFEDLKIEDWNSQICVSGRAC